MKVYLRLNDREVSFLGRLRQGEIGSSFFIDHDPKALASPYIYNRHGEKLGLRENFDYGGHLEMIVGNLIVNKASSYLEYSIGKSYVLENGIQVNNARLLGIYDLV